MQSFSCIFFLAILLFEKIKTHPINDPINDFEKKAQSHFNFDVQLCMKNQSCPQIWKQQQKRPVANFFSKTRVICTKIALTNEMIVIILHTLRRMHFEIK